MAIEGFANSTEFQDYYGARNRWSTQLAQDLPSSGTVMYVTSVADLPDKGYVSINFEVIFYGSVNAGNNSLGSLQRAMGYNSVAATHAAGSQVQQRISDVAFNSLMTAVKKRKQYQLTSSQVAALATSSQNITGFASRARIAEMSFTASGGSEDFVVELYRRDTFKGADRIYKTVNLNGVETVTDQLSSGTTVYVTSTSGFLIDNLVAIGDLFTSGGVWEFAMVSDIASGDYLTLTDALTNSYASGKAVRLVHRDQDEFYYEDLDWTGELHIRIINNDALNPVRLFINIIAEVSDES